MKDVIGIGTLCMDFLVHLDHLPTQKDESAAMLENSWQGGGKVATAMAALGQLGGTGSMIGVAGADEYGDFLVEDLAYYGIDTSRIIQDGRNEFSVVLSDEHTLGRNILNRDTTGRRLTVDDLDADFIADHKILHLERADEVAHAAADMIHASGGRVAFDGDGYNPQTLMMLPKIDIFIGSEFFYHSLFGDSLDYRKNISSLLTRGDQIIGFSLGAKGSAVAWKDQFHFAPGYDVKVVDTVGAGDVYHGAFLYAITHEMDPGQSAQFANAVAGIKCTAIGGRAGIPDLDTVTRFMRDGALDRHVIELKVRRYATFGGK